MLTEPNESKISELVDKWWSDLCRENLTSPKDKGIIEWLKSSFHETSDSKVKAEKRGHSKVICVSGSNLEWIFQNQKKKFIQLCAECSAVLCCRITPKMKGQVVQACHAILGCRSLSIGDGANDVPMIQEWALSLFYTESFLMNEFYFKLLRYL